MPSTSLRNPRSGYRCAPAPKSRPAPNSCHSNPGRPTTRGVRYPAPVSTHERAGQRADPATLVDVDALIGAYYDRRPDPADPTQRVAFGTSGHRGSAFRGAFNEVHILAITEAIVRYRRSRGYAGPLFIGKDSHGLSEPAQRTALEVLVAHGVDVGAHAYDLLRFLIGAEVEAVTAMRAAGESGALDRTILALLRFSNGVLTYAQVSQALSQVDVRVDISGSAGGVEWIDWMAPYRSGTATIRTDAGIERIDSACPDAYDRLVAAFEESVRGGTVPDPSPFDALQSTRIALAVKASARSRREVRLGA